jgi:DNA-binding CsgD family transcriptional regulator
MTLDQSYMGLLRDLRPHNGAEQKINQLQADLVYAARIWAMDEIGAAIAHELNEPLTALLLYLHAIEQVSAKRVEVGALAPSAPDPSAPDISTPDISAPDISAQDISAHDILQKALREAERACHMIERMRDVSAKPFDSGSAMARGREAIGAWARLRDADERTGLPASFPSHHTLTPRERQVLAQITAGTSNKEGGQHLGISTRTFEVHRAHIMEKLGAKNAADLVRIVLSEPANFN